VERSNFHRHRTPLPGGDCAAGEGRGLIFSLYVDEKLSAVSGAKVAAGDRVGGGFPSRTKRSDVERAAAGGAALGIGEVRQAAPELVQDLHSGG
jgi:hypothetical protein